ncbi:hypothetical protein EI94DRAFT_1704773 [Lactarius quietus]|nr:hypothetical protein EI94DRAFT_1704773 [Lactarius quietus]
MPQLGVICTQERHVVPVCMAGYSIPCTWHGMTRGSRRAICVNDGVGECTWVDDDSQGNLTGQKRWQKTISQIDDVPQSPVQQSKEHSMQLHVHSRSPFLPPSMMLPPDTTTTTERCASAKVPHIEDSQVAKPQHYPVHSHSHGYSHHGHGDLKALLECADSDAGTDCMAKEEDAEWTIGRKRQFIGILVFRVVKSARAINVSTTIQSALDPIAMTLADVQIDHKA